MNNKAILTMVFLSFGIEAMEAARQRQLETAIADRDLVVAQNVINAGIIITDELLEKAEKKATEKGMFGGEYPDSKAISDYVKKGKIRNLMEEMILKARQASLDKNDGSRGLAYVNVATRAEEIKKLEQEYKIILNFQVEPFRSSKSLDDVAIFFEKTNFSGNDAETLLPFFALLFQKGAELEKSSDSSKLFVGMMKNGREPFLKFLLQQPNMKYTLQEKLMGGDTLLHEAVTRGLTPEIIRFIIYEAPKLLNEKNDAGETPLYIAVKAQNLPVATLLLEKGAALDDAILKVAIEGKNKGIIDLLNKKIEGLNKTEKERKEKEAAEKMSKELKAVNAIQFRLTELAKKASSESAESIKKEIDDLVKYHGDYGRFINLGAFSGQFNAILLNILKRDQSKLDQKMVDEITRKLIDLGADLHVREDSKNALHYLVANKQIELLKFVLEYAKKKMSNRDERIFINHTDEEGNTPLHIAAGGYYEGGILGFGGTLNEALTKKVIELLINAGANKAIKNKEKLTPIEVTKDQKIKEMIDPRLILDREKAEKEAKEKKEREEKEALIKKEYAEEEKRLKLLEEERIRKEKEQAEKQKREQELRKKQQEEEKKRVELLAQADKELAERLQREEDEKKKKEEEELRKVVELELKQELELAEKARKAREAGEAIGLFTVALQQLKLTLEELANQITIYKLQK